MFDLERTEKSVMNLFGLITAIRSSAENLSGGDGEDTEKHCESVIELCDISREKLIEVWEAVSEVENKSVSTAEMISFLINDESVPDKISDALSSAVSDIFNHLPPECTAQRIEHSPEYIEAVLSDYDEAKSE
jgi:hypothetical protein